tara:strand:+ start:14629 stop:15255 length:627 start_codon:yes stop_codon:yes gene_type:complete
MKSHDKVLILLAVFITALVCANLLGSKITVIFGITVSVGIFAYPLTFLMTDAVEEVFGREKTKLFVYSGLIALLLTLLLVFIGKAMPPAGFYKNNDAYITVFSNSIRIIIASIIGFVVSQFHDIWAFNFIKRKTHGKFLWLRNNVSTIMSQFIDTVIFTFIAFYGVTADYNVAVMFKMIFPYWFLKVLFALADTPLVYILVKWLKNEH